MKTLAISLLVALLGCGGAKEITEEKDQPSMQSKKVIVEMGYEVKTDPITITSAEVKGTDLHISVSYSGGCRDHAFELFTDGSIMKSLPPKQYFFLRHYANEDQCESEITEDLVFDLSGTTAMGNSLVLLLEGYKGDLKMEF